MRCRWFQSVAPKVMTSRRLESTYCGHCIGGGVVRVLHATRGRGIRGDACVRTVRCGPLTGFQRVGADGRVGNPVPTVRIVPRYFYALSSTGTYVASYSDVNGVFHGFARAADGTFTTFSAPGAGTGAGQGGGGDSINPAGEIVGSYVDANNASHGFVRVADGKITTFDVPGAGAAAGQGTNVNNNNPAGAVAGYYVDANNVGHGFVRSPLGVFTTFDAPGAVAGGCGNNNALNLPSCGTTLTGLNPAGLVTGYYWDAKGAAHGFVGIPRIFAGDPKDPNCPRQSLVAVGFKHGGLIAAATALGFPSASALQDAIYASCGWQQ